MKKLTLVLVASGALVLSGCSGLSRTEQHLLSGGAIGAAGGAALGALTSAHLVTATVIGAAAGAAGGYVIDRSTR